MSHTKHINFESNMESHAPFITDSNDIELEANSKSNYSTMKKTEEFQPESNYSTVSSTNTADQKDTTILLHGHQGSIEEDIHRRSLKATFCMIFAMVMILGLIGIAIASLHDKLTYQNTEERGSTQNKTTLPKPEETNLFFNMTDDLPKHNSTFFLRT